MDEMYVNVEHAKPVDPTPSINQTGPRSSKGGFHGVIVLFLSLLSVFMLAGLIGLGVHYHNSERDSSAELSAMNTTLTEMTEELNRRQSLSKQKRTCPAGWRMFMCSCYLLSVEFGSWTRGREDCRNRGADLVVIGSAEEQTLLSDFTETETLSWIGLTDEDTEGTWKWIDGTPLTLSAYWEENQPDNGGGDPNWGEEDCAYVTTGKKTKENWNDRSCSASLRWMCEKNP